MRDYATVSPAFWTGETGRVLKKSGPETMLVAMYLVTSPHANALGLYYLPILFIAHETGLTFEGASKGLQRASEGGFCAYDYENEIVWVHEMARFQIGDSLSPKDNRVKWIKSEYKKLPNCKFLKHFFEKYKDIFYLDFERNFEAPSKPLRSQEQEQEQEQDKKECCATEVAQQVQNDFLISDEPFFLTAKKRKLKGKRLDWFNQFWDAFGYKKGKAQAADAWFDIPKLTDSLCKRIIESALHEARDRPELTSQGRTPKMAQGWISGRRWEDEEDKITSTIDTWAPPEQRKSK